jgi:hypothetical protein
MPHDIPESDWKRLRQLQPLALDRFCQRVLAEIQRIDSDLEKTAHQRYLAVFDLIHRRDKELADAFDDLSRSRALFKLACIQRHRLLTEEEMSGFTPATRDTVRLFLEGPSA